MRLDINPLNQMLSRRRTLKKYTIQPNQHYFTFGCCCLIAISEAFNLNIYKVIKVLKTFKINNIDNHVNGGLSTYDCNRLIKKINSRIKYVKFEASIEEFISLGIKETCILDLPEHLAVIKGNLITDTYLYYRVQSHTEIHVCGYWQLIEN